MSDALADVLAEMRRAREVHGDGYMGNLELVHEQTTEQEELRYALHRAGRMARAICDGPEPTRLAVLVEEVCELADDIDRVPFPRDELVQVAAMALAWLGVDPCVMKGADHD